MMALARAPSAPSAPPPRRSPSPSPAALFAGTLRAIRRELTCAVCQDLFKEPLLSPCSHTFCRDCIGNWVRTKHSCPLCVTRLTMRALNPEASLQRLVDAYVAIVAAYEDDFGHALSEDEAAIARREWHPNPIDNLSQLFPYPDKPRAPPAAAARNADADADDASGPAAAPMLVDSPAHSPSRPMPPPAPAAAHPSSSSSLSLASSSSTGSSMPAARSPTGITYQQLLRATGLASSPLSNRSGTTTESAPPTSERDPRSDDGAMRAQAALTPTRVRPMGPRTSEERRRLVEAALLPELPDFTTSGSLHTGGAAAEARGVHGTRPDDDEDDVVDSEEVSTSIAALRAASQLPARLLSPTAVSASTQCAPPVAPVSLHRRVFVLEDTDEDATPDLPPTFRVAIESTGPVRRALQPSNRATPAPRPAAKDKRLSSVTAEVDTPAGKRPRRRMSESDHTAPMDVSVVTAVAQPAPAATAALEQASDSSECDLPPLPWALQTSKPPNDAPLVLSAPVPEPASPPPQSLQPQLRARLAPPRDAFSLVHSSSLLVPASSSSLSVPARPPTRSSVLLDDLTVQPGSPQPAMDEDDAPRALQLSTTPETAPQQPQPQPQPQPQQSVEDEVLSNLPVSTQEVYRRLQEIDQDLANISEADCEADNAPAQEPATVSMPSPPQQRASPLRPQQGTPTVVRLVDYDDDDGDDNDDKNKEDYERERGKAVARTDEDLTMASSPAPPLPAPPAEPLQEPPAPSALADSLAAFDAASLLSSSLPLAASEPTRFVFVHTSLSRQQKKIVQKVADELGAEVSQAVDERTTHLITATDDNLFAPSPTLKFLQGILLGKFLISYAWIERCAEMHRWVPEEPYEVRGGSNQIESFGPKRARLAVAQKERPLLAGVSFVVRGEEWCGGLTTADVHHIIGLAGGRVVHAPGEASADLLVVLCGEEPGLTLEVELELGVRPRDLLWLVECIYMYTLQSPERRPASHDVDLSLDV